MVSMEKFYQAYQLTAAINPPTSIRDEQSVRLLAPLFVPPLRVFAIYKACQRCDGRY
jgi:hypothetical protein